LWNAVGFPDQAPDDGTYIRRALNVVNGLGPQEGTFYDHPYFGQVFLGTIFTIIDYPDLAVPSMPATLQDLERSVDTLYTVPRILMGTLAVIDTFLIYKIAERRYNRNVGFIAAVLFAVTPVGWLFRRMYLDPIQLPFLLTSILFALYSGTKAKTETKAKQKSKLKEMVEVGSREGTSEKATEEQRQGEGYDNNYNDYKNMSSSNQNIVLLLSSGVFMGLTIFAKIPAIALIPLVGFIVFTNNKKSLKALGIWIIPVILIPMIWPAYALSTGELDKWLDGAVWQATKGGVAESSLNNSLRDLLRIDPVLILLGSVSFVYAALRKDPLIVLWIIPFIIFFYFVGRITYNYWVPLLPAFCIGISVLVIELSDKIRSRISKFMGQFLPFAVIFLVAIFGLIINVMLISANLTSSQIQAAAFVQYQLNNEKMMKNNNILSASNVTVISGPNYSWIFKYVFKEDNVLDNFRDRTPIDTEKFIMMTDLLYKAFLRRDNTDRSERLEVLYDNTVSIAKFKGDASKYDYDKYPYFSIRQGRSGSEIDIRSSY
jgi:4-amino-4-deoxy-L-arabinose transferase-like glycosyltransferase